MRCLISEEEVCRVLLCPSPSQSSNAASQLSEVSLIRFSQKDSKMLKEHLIFHEKINVGILTATEIF